MPSPALFGPDVALYTLLEHSTYSFARLGAHPLTVEYAPAFDAFQARWMQVNAQEIQLRLAILKATALIVATDDDLDHLLDVLVNILLSLTGNKKDAPLYRLYIGDKTPSALKRPVLGVQLEMMRGWIGSLKESQHAPLNGVGMELEQKVASGDTARKLLATAQQDNRVFRTTGERRSLIDEFNALRKSTYGKLAELPHKHPDKNLPNSFADGFFKRVSQKPDEEEEVELTSAELLVKITEAELQVKTLRDRYKEVVEKEKDAAEAAKKQQQHEEKLAALRKQREQIDAEIAAMTTKPED